MTVTSQCLYKDTSSPYILNYTLVEKNNNPVETGLFSVERAVTGA